MMETKLWESNPVQEKVQIIFKLLIYYVQIRNLSCNMDGLDVHYINPF